MKLNFVIFSIVFLCGVFIKAEKLSSLQIKDLDISLKYLTYGSYSASVKIPIQSDEMSYIIYCWKKMRTVPQKNGQNCDLIEEEHEYRCVEINYQRLENSNTSDTSWASNPKSIKITWNELRYSKQKGFISQGNSSVDIQVSQPQNLTRSLDLKNQYLSNSSIYHMITATSRQMLETYNQKSTQAKLSYVHTFSHPSYTDTLISQRNYYCILYMNKVIYIFQGAVSRIGQLHYFTSILTTTTNSQPFHMWGGYSYSSGHAARDMVGYETTTADFYDMYSLYAAAPFEDIADNVRGKKNVVRISNSGSESSISQTPYHFIQFYRLFDTADINGDQIIRDKIYNRFCFAAYFQNYTYQISDYPLSVFSNSFKHQLIDCHIPDLSIFQTCLKPIYFLFTLIIFSSLI